MRFAKPYFLLAIVCVLASCHKQTTPSSVETEVIAIIADSATMQTEAAKAYTDALSAKKAALQSEMQTIVGYAAHDMKVDRPECTMLNWATDVLLSKAREYYNGQVDMAVTNIGGMRCEWKEGAITKQHIFELMPFDNRLVVLTLKGEDILELCQVFAEVGGEGVAGLRMQAEDKQLIDAQINGKSVDPEAYYTVATSDYLSGGTDNMTPLTRHIAYWDSDKLIRDIYMEYVKEKQTIASAIDHRMDIH